MTAAPAPESGRPQGRPDGRDGRPPQAGPRPHGRGGSVRPADLRIAGLVPMSTCDWPGHMVATLFCQGCPWDCFYCHNPGLIPPRTPGAVTWDEVEALLARRHGLLDGVVFSGGEPTMQRALRPAVERVRELGYAVGLHTCGAYPRAVAELLPLVDWVGLDVKALPEDYERVTGRATAGRHAWETLHVVLDRDRRARAGEGTPFDYEVRTTIHPAVFDAERLGALARALRAEGVEHYAVQDFRTTGVRIRMPDHGGAPLPAGDAEQRPVDTHAAEAAGFTKFWHRAA